MFFANCSNCSGQIGDLKLLLNREFTKIRQELLAEVKFYSRTVSPQLNVLLDNFYDVIQLNEANHKQYAATIQKSEPADYIFQSFTTEDQPLLIKYESEDDDDEGQTMLVPDDSSSCNSPPPTLPMTTQKSQPSEFFDPFADDDDEDDSSWIVHNSNDGNTDLVFPALCEFCPERFDNITEYNNHTHKEPRRPQLGRGNQKAICDICAKICANVFILRSHYTTHFERYFYFYLHRFARMQFFTFRTRPMCDICKRTCASRSSLKRHMLSHNNQREFACRVCDKQFNMSEALKCHMRLVFLIRRSVIINILLLNSRIHTGEKPYKCSYCDKAFSAQHHMKAHLHIHTGDMPYSCPLCRQSFRERFGVRRHLSREHHVLKEDMAIVFPNRFQLLNAKEES